MSHCLQEWLTRQAARIPDAVAVAMGQEKLTYRQLEESSNRLAWALAEYGCRKGDRVCLLAPKSLTAVQGILGILKADAICVPLDTSNPVQRLKKIVAA